MKKIFYTIIMLAFSFQMLSAQFQIGQTLHGRNSDSQYGISTAISENGLRMIISGANDSSPPNGTGYVQVYDWI